MGHSRSRSRGKDTSTKRSPSRSRSRSVSGSYSYSDYSDYSDNNSYSGYSYDSSSRSVSKEKTIEEVKIEAKPIVPEKKMIKGPDGEMIEKEEANYGVTGALGKDRNTGVMFNGVLLKWCEPADAAKPSLKWRIYEFKESAIVDTKYLHRCSAFLIGHDERVCDWILLHESISKQHAVLQFRKVPMVRIRLLDNMKNSRDKSEFRRMMIKPYVMDLDSTNGTLLNGKKIESSRYYELKEGDELRFGFSTRSYVLLNENSVVGDEIPNGNEVHSDKEDNI